jgi:hypothetical protein
MNEYWKDPRLDDEGTYDYLVEELPKDTAKWEWYYEICQSCGKEHRLNFDSTHYFYCWDGWDSMTYVECWRCRLNDKIYSIKSKIKKNTIKKIQQRKEYYELLKKLKAKNIPITKETKDTLLKICQRGV